MGKKSRRKRIALSLGSGGARGYAHIGVIEAIEARGWDVVGVAGSSMGAVIGGLYVTGALPEYAEWVTKLGKRDVLRLLDPSIGGPGMMRASKVMGVVKDLIGDAVIEDASVPYTAVAVDLVSQREVWFTSGPMVDAMRASMAMPGVFTPLVKHGMVLADGGLLNPVPVVPLADVHADAIIAVNLSGAAEAPRRTSVMSAVGLRLPKLRLPGLPSIVDPALRALLPGARRGADAASAVAGAGPADEPLVRPERREGISLSALDVIDRSVHVMQDAVLRYRLAGYPPDVLIEIPLDVCGTMDYHRAAEVIAVGRERAEQALDGWEPARRRL